MNWTILTPDESVTWDQSELNYFEGVDRSAAPSSDQLEDLWRTYTPTFSIRLASSSKPCVPRCLCDTGRLCLRQVSSDEMLKAAPQRVEKMIKLSEVLRVRRETFFQHLAKNQSHGHIG